METAMPRRKGLLYRYFKLWRRLKRQFRIWSVKNSKSIINVIAILLACLFIVAVIVALAWMRVLAAMVVA
ncbi:MAG: hypothetical protein HPY52_16700 [Firmicutes bacterium]|nr:hypothetical protein [Bacillota bacterium]